jgi:hypothetical protein
LILSLAPAALSTLSTLILSLSPAALSTLSTLILPLASVSKHGRKPSGNSPRSPVFVD